MAQDKDQKTLNVPPLRFTGFTDEWKECTIRDIAKIEKGNGISKDQLSEEGDECILYGELYTKYKSEIIDEVYSKTKVDSTKLMRSQANDVLIPCSGETAEDIATARCVKMEGILLGGDLNIMRFDKQDGAFMSYQLNGKRKYDIARVAQGVSVVHLYPEHLKSIKVVLPELEEQQKIVNLLSLIDERIATQNKIIDNLQSLIKGLRELLFKPLLSYFVKLGNIAQITNGSGDVQDAVSDYQNGLYPFFDRSDEMKYFRDYSFDAEAIIYAGEGAEFLPRYYNGKFALHQRCYAITTFSSDFLPRYIYHYLQTQNNYFIRNAVGSTVPSLRIDCFLKIGIPIADKEIQDSIINRLDRLSEKINNEKNILSLYQRQKTFLLQKLFI